MDLTTETIRQAADKFTGQGAGWAELGIMIAAGWFFVSKATNAIHSFRESMTAELKEIKNEVKELGEKLLKTELHMQNRMNIQDVHINSNKEMTLSLKDKLDDLSRKIEHQTGRMDAQEARN